MRLAAVLVLWLLMPSSLLAGPWPRETGTHFLSVSGEFWESNLPDIPHYYGSLFYEYGLSERLTLATKLEMGSEAGTSGDLRLGVSLVSGKPYALSLEMAVGLRDIYRFLIVYDATLPVDLRARFGQVGLAYGRGFQLAGRNAWLATELTAIAPLDEPEPALGLGGTVWKWDTTLGLKFDNGLMLLGQVFASRDQHGDGLIKLAPGLAIPVGDRHHVEIGLRLPTASPESRALALGIWREF